MALTATGIGSGLDISNIVQVLVDAQKVPKEAIFNKTEDSIDAKISALGTLKSDLGKFQDALALLKDGNSLNQRKVSTGESLYLGAEVSKSAQPGRYSIKVEQLAQAHKLAGASVADASAGVGEGTLAFSVNSSNFSVSIASSDSLNAIATKVNDAAGNIGVSATVIKTDAGSRLVFSTEQPGFDHQIGLTATDISGSGLSNMFSSPAQTTLQAAQNSIIHIDGQQLTSQTNSISDAITGVTLDLTDADVTKITTLSIEQDDDAVKKNIKSFVDAYNSLMSSFDNLSAYNSDKNTSAALQGDSLIRSLESQFRNKVSDRVDDGTGSNIALYDIGISIDRYGKMIVSDTELNTALQNDMDKVEKLFATPNMGIASSLDTLVETYVKTGGLIDSRNNSYTNEQQRLTDKKAAFSLQMEQLEARLLKQFNAMDLVVAQLNQQSAGLAERLNSLPGVIGN